jgi:hypothetical protein
VAADVRIACLGGNCPVQAEGTINGKAFYFRARGTEWTIGIGGDEVLFPEWSDGAPYGNGPYDAGWMPEEEARAFILASAEKYDAETRPVSAGPDRSGSAPSS